MFVFQDHLPPSSVLRIDRCCSLAICFRSRSTSYPPPNAVTPQSPPPAIRHLTLLPFPLLSLNTVDLPSTHKDSSEPSFIPRLKMQSGLLPLPEKIGNSFVSSRVLVSCLEPIFVSGGVARSPADGILFV